MLIAQRTPARLRSPIGTSALWLRCLAWWLPSTVIALIVIAASGFLIRPHAGQRGRQHGTPCSWGRLRVIGHAVLNPRHTDQHGERV